MTDGLIPQRYAKALFKFASDRGDTSAVYDEMKRVAAAFDNNPALAKTLANPFVARADKEKLLLGAAGSDPGYEYRQFVRLILDHRREEYARLMALSYLAQYREVNDIREVVITTAAPMEDSEIDRLRDMVKHAFPKATLEFSYKTDPDIIGGFIVNVDSVSMNASISNEIEQLRQKLLSNN